MFAVPLNMPGAEFRQSVWRVYKICLAQRFALINNKLMSLVVLRQLGLWPVKIDTIASELLCPVIALLGPMEP